MNNTQVFKFNNVIFPAGPAYRPLSDFQVKNPFSDLPYIEGLVGAYFPTSQNSNPLNNHANLSVPLLRIGSPAINDSYAQCSDGNYFDTQLMMTEDATMIALTANPSASQGDWIISNYSGSNSEGSDSLVATENNGAQVYSLLNGEVISNTIATASGLVSVAGRFNASSAEISYYDPTTGTVQKGVADGSRSFKSTKSLLIGQRQGMTGNGTAKVSVVLIYNQRLTDENLLSVMTYLRKIFIPQHNITV
ncbi:hypothetical protein [Rosenbergiella collisarenosi]|uniref:hypothetical protein n=1 Tax=Rosenbergiella collisarenosi TaxID=1544695 RepID=UPI001F5041F8|nr:hypothetical protein [Rosenbergiella collisarenosi]